MWLLYEVPLYDVGTDCSIKSPKGIHEPIHLHHTHTTAGAAEGCHLSAPQISVWVIPGEELKCHEEVLPFCFNIFVVLLSVK